MCIACRRSATVINAQHPYLYPGGAKEGFVLAPSLSLLCAYNGDAASGVKPRGGCGEGWSPSGHGGGWGKGGAADAPPLKEGTPWTPSLLRAVLEGQGKQSFNELIVGRADWEAGLPHNLLAVVYIGDDAENRAHSVHATLLARFGLEASALPLLRVRNVATTFSIWSVEAFVDVSPAPPPMPPPAGAKAKVKTKQHG